MSQMSLVAKYQTRVPYNCRLSMFGGLRLGLEI